MSTMIAYGTSNLNNTEDSGHCHCTSLSKAKGLNTMIEKKIIVRTYSAGVWFGTLTAKDGNEIYLTDARRMWSWYVEKNPETGKRGISLSSISLFGIDQSQSKIEPPVDVVWLEAIELIPCTDLAIKSIEDAPHASA